MKVSSQWQKQLVMGIFPLLFGLQLVAAISAIRPALSGYVDFRQMYTGAFIMHSGLRHSLYDEDLQNQIEESRMAHRPNLVVANHPSYEYWLLSPLASLSYRQAYIVWLALDLIALALIWMLMPQADRWLRTCLLLGFTPVYVTMIHGQDTLWFLVILLLAFRNQDEAQSGAILGCAAFRYNLLLPILLAYIIWKRWRFVAGAMTSATACAIWSVGLIGITQSIAYVRLAASSVGSNAEVSMLHGCLAIVGTHRSVGILLWSACAAWCLWMIRRAQRSLATAVLLVPVFSYHLLPHDLVILILPIALTITEGIAPIAQFFAAAATIVPFGYLTATLPCPLMLRLFAHPVTANVARGDLVQGRSAGPVNDAESIDRSGVLVRSGGHPA